jgi:hypothetical protein
LSAGAANELYQKDQELAYLRKKLEQLHEYEMKFALLGTEMERLHIVIEHLETLRLQHVAVERALNSEIASLKNKIIEYESKITVLVAENERLQITKKYL